MQSLLTIALLAYSALVVAKDYTYIRIPKKSLTKSWIQSSGFIEDHMRYADYVVGYLPTSKTMPLSAVELDAEKWARAKYDIETLLPIAESTPPAKIYEDYHTYETLKAELTQLAKIAPSLVTLKSAGKSVEGRDLFYLVITNSSTNNIPKPKLLYVSSMHGDEVTGKEMMIYLSRSLIKKYTTDKRIQRIVDGAEIFIMPSMNPDGTEMGKRFNANKVDLNRDFPDLDEQPWNTNREPETIALQNLHKQNHFDVALNFHGGTLCLNLPWDSKENIQQTLFGDNALAMLLGKTYTAHNTPMLNHHESNFNHGITYGYEWYPIYGGMQDWADYFLESTHSTAEISEIKWPSAATLPQFWKENEESLLSYLERGMTGIHLKVEDISGKPLPVEVKISSAKRVLHYTGTVHRPSIDGMQTVTISSPGYKTQTLQILPKQNDGTLQTVVLEQFNLPI